MPSPLLLPIFTLLLACDFIHGSMAKRSLALRETAGSRGCTSNVESGDDHGYVALRSAGFCTFHVTSAQPSSSSTAVFSAFNVRITGLSNK